MKLPKQFGGQNLGQMMRQAQEAYQKAQTMQQELEEARIQVDKGPIKATFDGVGRMHAISIDPAVVAPDDVEALEDLVLSVARDGFEKAQLERERRMREIMPNMPDVSGL
jgi:DNA-binding YbaB/EbfC family protein